MKIFRQLLLPAVLGVLLAGCSTLGVRIDSSLGSQRRETRELLAALPGSLPDAGTFRAANARGVSPDQRLALLLATARAAAPAAFDGDPPSRDLYNAAVAQVVAVMKAGNFAARTVPKDGSPWHLEVARPDGQQLDPTQVSGVIRSSRVRITGLGQRSVQEGVGVPYVFCFARDSAFLAGQPGIPPVGIATPATAVLTFQGSTARVTFYNPLRSDRAVLDRHPVKLAADFSAPVAVLINRSGNRSIDVRLLLKTRQNFPRAGLFQFQAYDPNKIPVVFVHGLLARPEAWTHALNGLLADRRIRERYQFWFLLYPTGLPIWKSAALLRSELDRYHAVLERDGRNPRMQEIVLIGHSMGGLIASLVIREGGDKLWRQFSDVQPAKLALSPAARKLMEQFFYFPPRRDISRVIFVATPHRGSRLAINPVVNIVSRLIQLPGLFYQGDRQTLVAALHTDVRDLFATPANSIRFLRANSPLLISIQELPLARPIPYHSIIGDRGRGNTPRSSDGVVPYWSSHLAGATSEKIVPSGHGANEHPAAIEEMRRILDEAVTR